MKRLIYILSLALFFGMSNFSQAQEPSKQSNKEKREVRKAQRAAMEAVYGTALVEALTNKDFGFTADYFSAGSITHQPITSAFRTMDVNPDYLIVRLPYISTTRSIETTPLTIDFQVNEYKYTYEFKNGVHYVKITVSNVRNNQSESKMQNGSYVFNFQISSDGSAIVNVSPAYMSSITYNGNISLGNLLN